MRKRPLMRKLNQHYENSESLEQKYKSVSLSKNTLLLQTKLKCNRKTSKNRYLNIF
jgi:hypothetical protein